MKDLDIEVIQEIMENIHELFVHKDKEIRNTILENIAMCCLALNNEVAEKVWFYILKLNVHESIDIYFELMNFLDEVLKDFNKDKKDLSSSSNSL